MPHSQNQENPTSRWIVYILECSDKTLYTGITTDLNRRLHAHRTGKGAKYTRGRGPFTVIFIETYPSKSLALKREAEIKLLDKLSKLRLGGIAI